MRAVVVYESMYGNTHAVANAIAEGLRSTFDVVVTPVGEADQGKVGSADLLVVGGPTHVHGLSTAMSRKAAADTAAKPDDEHELDPDAEGPGLRDWFDNLLPTSGQRAAAFDTRFDASPVLTGRASKGIARRLHKHKYELVAEPESFLVDKQDHLLDGEAERARGWAEQLAKT